MVHKHKFTNYQFEDGTYDPLRCICECGAVEEWNPHTGQKETVYIGKAAIEKIVNIERNYLDYKYKHKIT